jgi:hypothetical protein
VTPNVVSPTAALREAVVSLVRASGLAPRPTYQKSFTGRAEALSPIHGVALLT